MTSFDLKHVHREFRPFFKELLALGWTFTIGAKSIKLRSPKGGIVVASKTPSCPFSLQHVKGDVKRVMRREGAT